MIMFKNQCIFRVCVEIKIILLFEVSDCKLDFSK